METIININNIASYLYILFLYLINGIEYNIRLKFLFIFIQVDLYIIPISNRKEICPTSDDSTAGYIRNNLGYSQIIYIYVFIQYSISNCYKQFRLLSGALPCGVRSEFEPDQRQVWDEYISDNYLWPIGQRSKLNLFDRLKDSNGSQWISENSLAILICFSVEILQLDLGDMNCLYIFINVFNQSFF